MARIPAHTIDEIMSTARIEEVIAEYVQLKRAGSNLKGLSPFTVEKTPSFMVSPAKQIFKCFSTGKGGTVVTFLMEIEQFSYPEALRWLAERYNIQMPEEKPLTVEEQLELTERESLQIINNFARDFFVNTMKNTEEGRNVGYSYFKERAFRPDIIEKFQLGFCPQIEKSLTDTALEKGYKQIYLEKLGLSKTKDGRHFDFFSGRVIFPIHSASGKVLGFGGRTLRTGSKVAKYFNSPESILYDKSRTLYGIFFAKNEIIKNDNCFLVEGYADVISMFQSGIENVVASSGTSLTKGQIKLIQRYTNNITVLYDSDPAGIKASFRGIDLLLEEGMKVKVLIFPEGDDPDSFAKRVSTNELKEYIDENEQDFIGFKTSVLLEGTQNDPIKRAELIREIVSSIALIPDAITRLVYVKETASLFEMEEATLLAELNRIRRKIQNEQLKSQQREQRSFKEKEVDEDISHLIGSKKNETEHQRSFFDQEFDLIRILVLYGSRAIEIKNEADDAKEETLEVGVSELIVNEVERDKLSFDTPIFQKIFDICKQGLEENIFYEAKHFLRNEDVEIVKFVTDILSTQYEISSGWMNKFKIETTEEIHQLSKAVKDSLYSFKEKVILKKRTEIQLKLKERKDLTDEEQNELLKELIVLEKIRGSFVSELGRIIS